MRLFDRKIAISLAMIVVVVAIGVHFGSKSGAIEGDSLVLPRVKKDLERKKIFNWKSQKEYIYSLDFHSKGEFQLQMGAIGPKNSVLTPFSYDISAAKLHFCPVDLKGAQTKALIWIEAPKLNFVFGIANDGFLEKLRANLQRRILVDIDEKGLPSRYYFYQNTDPITRNLVRQVVASFLAPRVVGMVQEEIISGRLSSEVTLTQTGTNKLIAKKFSSLKIPSAPHYFATILGGIRYEFLSDNQSIRLIEGERKIGIRSGKNLISQERLWLKFELQGVRDSLLAKNFLTKGFSDYSKFSNNGTEEFLEAKRKLLLKQVKGTNLTEQLARLDAMAEGVDISSSGDLFQKLSAFLELDPELIHDVAATLHKYDGKDPRFDFIATVLAKNGSALAQQSLLEVMDQHWDHHDTSVQLLFNLALIENPSTDTADHLLILTSDTPFDHPNYTQLLGALGGCGYNIKDREKKDEIADVIFNFIHNSGAKESELYGMNALGNLGHDKNVAFAGRWLKDSNPVKRKRGLEAIRRVDGKKSQKATELLITSASTDPDVNVRRDAAKYLLGRNITESSVKELKNRLYEEKDVTVVIALLDSIDGSGLDQEAIKGVLGDYFKECGHPKVCAKVEGLLLRNM